MTKEDGAFLTISELSAELGLPQHILRYWETRFPQLRPLQRSGNRRYYRPDDVALVKRIDRLPNVQGFTVRGAQKALSDGDGHARPLPEPVGDDSASAASSNLLDRLQVIRATLARAIGEQV